ncbi:cyclase family protein [Pseudoalteromonas sp. Cnat2-41]|uniref:cyclase family protein n=1 Tax=unclassified Pseudoalteromonas TaxID=194690 RepID=UPI001EF85043|nr:MULTISPECIES: cyclase family protein [unclassified Pseudoalteromonas]MCF2860803.1 cyclase family protein [Pseudoalteromonas sp. CNAT2-18]MCG7556672.1 cyclase family protein [Pseudoalteromonas sp. CNAT2-18.1]MCG7569093.1 cyclase family protein [Pseudoalteromonas sp. CNC9-20]
MKYILLLAALMFTHSGLGAQAKLLESLSKARIIELNHVWDHNSPLLSFNPPYALALMDNHQDTQGMIPELSFAADIMYFSGQHGAPNLDAIGHIGHNGQAYGGISTDAIDGARGLKELGIEQYPRERLLNRAALLDVARFKGVSHLPGGYEITVKDLQDTAKAQQVRIKAGMSVLIRTGFGQFFNTDNATYLGPRPGPGQSAAQWLAQQHVFLAGADQLSFEVVPESGTRFPAHRILLAQHGIYIVENLNLEALSEALAKGKSNEFMLVLNPPRVRGATGMAVNAFAILP